MAATSSGFPSWFLDCKDDVTKTKEWRLFVSELHDAVQQQLSESHVQYFSDLSEAERRLFVDRAVRALHQGHPFQELLATVSSHLDHDLNTAVAKALLDDADVPSTRTDLVLDEAESLATALLRKWPVMRDKLHICLNQPLPIGLRQVAWKLYLTDTKVRKQYVDLLSVNPRAAISPLDLEISQKCEYLLNSEPTFRDLKGSIGAFYAMKAVLSYTHALRRSRSRLQDTDYLLVVPFVQVFSPNMSRREPASGAMVALLVEEYLTFRRSRPAFLTGPTSQDDPDEMEGFVEKLMILVNKHVPELASILASHNDEQHELIEDDESTQETTDPVLSHHHLEHLIRPIIRTLFVGYLNMETLLYVWDQYMLGTECPVFQQQWLCIVMATMLQLLHGKLQECTKPAVLQTVLKTEGPKLTVQQFQYEIQRHHVTELRPLLKSDDDTTALPVLDPTQMSSAPWRAWYENNIPGYTHPADRRRAREEREAERERLLNQKRDAEEQLKDEQDRENRELEAERLRAIALAEGHAEDEKSLLQQQLEQERQMREESERAAQAQIEQLREEIERLRNAQNRAPSAYSVYSYISRVLVPPPPTPASQASRMTFLPPPSRKSTPADRTVEKTLRDILEKVRGGVDRMVHGEGSEKSALDTATEGFMKQHIADIKRAEVSIFGHDLGEGEYDNLSVERQKETSDKMMKLIQGYRDERVQQK